MLLWNLDLSAPKSEMLVNGSRGLIVGWKSKEKKMKELSTKTAEDFRHEKMYESLKTPIGNNPKTAEEFRHEKMYEALKKSSIKNIPIVQFTNGRVEDCVPVEFDHDVLNVGKCTRLQVGSIFQMFVLYLLLWYGCLSITATF